MKRKTNKEVLLSEERTLLSKERTILSFMSTALAFIGVGIVIIKLFENSSIQIIGYLVVVIGFVEIGESLRRLKGKQRQMSKLEKQTGI
ncbi:MAG TPA: DUF202 domain-containing protein [Candidatus Aenigmarchaeota archaeon]|nr:DUF202 domain-containing protein [Candidatus Aenigmarchaeota archaeon]